MIGDILLKKNSYSGYTHSGIILLPTIQINKFKTFFITINNNNNNNNNN